MEELNTVVKPKHLFLSRVVKKIPKRKPKVISDDTRPTSITIPWTEEEDKTILEGVKEFGTNWELISDILNSFPFSKSRKRPSHLCYERWRTTLSEGNKQKKKKVVTKKKKEELNYLDAENKTTTGPTYKTLLSVINNQKSKRPSFEAQRKVSKPVKVEKPQPKSLPQSIHMEFNPLKVLSQFSTLDFSNPIDQQRSVRMPIKTLVKNRPTPSKVLASNIVKKHPHLESECRAILNSATSEQIKLNGLRNAVYKNDPNDPILVQIVQHFFSEEKRPTAPPKMDK